MEVAGLASTASPQKKHTNGLRESGISMSAAPTPAILARASGGQKK